MRPFPRVVFLSLSSFLPLALTGCMLSTTAAPTPETGLAINGSVHGGQGPIVGAHVYLLAANAGVFTPNTNGYGNASLSLLKNVAGQTTLDTSSGPTNGFYYVTTDSNGSFAITGDYTCVGGQQVYMYSLGGDPGLGSGSNAAAGLMAALGTCPGSIGANHIFSSALFVTINEVSTVAAAYSFAGFATDALHVSSSGTTQAKAGIANAFVNAAVLETLATGVANANPPALPTGAGGGAVPQAEINTLGNILAACVNSNGTVSACTTLFANAKSGGTTGTPPTDTATAAINIAHNPVAAVGTLYGLSSAYAQFAPTLTAQPNDFTMSIYYNDNFVNQGGPFAIDGSGNVWIAAGAMTELNGQGYDFTGGNGYSGFSADYVAIDVNGNAWATNANGVGKFSPSGTVTPSGGWSTGLGLSTPLSIAMDASTNAWIANSGIGNVVKVSSTGTLSGTFAGSGISAAYRVAIDPSGDAWIADENTNAIVELSPTGSPLSGATGYTGVGVSGPTGIAIDHNGNVWVTSGNGTNGNVVEISNTGVLISPVAGYTSSSLSNPSSIAIDGAGNAWLVGVSTTTEISSGGTFLSGSNGFASSANGAIGIAIDASGDVWTNAVSFNFLFGFTYYMQEMVGAAVPVVTPLSVGVKNNTLGTRP